MKKKTAQGSVMRILKPLLLTGHVLLALYLFLARPLGMNANMSRLMLCLTLPVDWMLFHPKKPELRNRVLKPVTLIFALLIAAYAAFAFFGTDLFQLTEQEMQVEPECFAALGWLALWFWPVILSVLYLLHCACEPSDTPAQLRNKKKAAAVLFGSLLLTEILIALIWSPGYYTTDAISVLKQSKGIDPLSDWHPFLNAVIAMPVVAICGKAWFITMVQAIIPALVLAAFLLELYDMGARLSTLTVCGILYLLLPNQLLNHITVQKDTPFTWAMLWVTLQLIRAVRNPENAKKPLWIIETVIAVFLVFGLRHNGLAAAAAACVVLAVMGIVRLFRRNARRAGACLLAAGLLPAVLFGVWKGPVSKALKVAPNEQSTFIPILDAVGAVYNNFGCLDEEYEEWLEEVQPLDDWGYYYGRYVGHDNYLWDQTKEYGFDTSSVTFERAMALLKAVMADYPEIAVHDRLDGSNIVWAVTMPEGSFNNRWIDYVYGSNEEFIDTPFGKSELAKSIRTFYQKYIQELSTDELLDPVIWRSGLYLILMLCLMLFWATGRDRRRWLIPAAPVIAHIILSMCVVYHQTFRYVWGIQVITLAMLAVTVVAGQSGLCVKKK